MKGIVATIEIGTGQGKELSQGVKVMEEIEALAYKIIQCMNGIPEGVTASTIRRATEQLTG